MRLFFDGKTTLGNESFELFLCVHEIVGRHKFLFGSERAELSEVAGVLREVQGGGVLWTMRGTTKRRLDENLLMSDFSWL
jgi:hypothetical protein